jgi:TP901 family phage tail tape measure protein
MAQAGTVWVDVRGNTAPLTRDIGKAAAAASALAIAGLGVAAVRESTQFNKAISGVGAVANATAADLENLRKAALQAGADTAFSASEAATAEAELAKAGLSTADILGGALSGSLDLAAAGQLALGDAATITAQALNTFNLNGSDTSHVADVLAAGANKSAADVSQLGQALAQGGLVAKQTGLSLEDTVGVLSLFADNALVGSDAGTSLKTALQRLVPQSAEAAGAMKDLGLTFFDAQGNFVGIEETASRLQQALGGLSTEQRQTALTTIFGADAIRAAGLLYEAGGAGVREYTSAVNDVGAAQRVASAQLDNLAGDFEQLKGSVETVLIGLGSSADSGLREIVQALTAGVNSVGEFVQSPVFNQVTEAIGGALGGLADGLTNAGDGLESFLGRLDTDEVSGFFGALADGAEGLEGPLLGVATALASLSAQRLPFVGGLIPGMSPLQGALAGLVLQSEEGREALGSMFDLAGEGVQALTPLLDVASDGLALLAGNGDLVRVALSGFVGLKVAQFLVPLASGAIGAGRAIASLYASINAASLSSGLSRLGVLRAALSGSGGLTGAIGAANIATAGLTATIGAGLFVYQNWASDVSRVEDETRSLTQALLEQADASAGEILSKQFAQILDTRGDTEDGFAAAFAKTGLAISDVTAVVKENAGEFDKFRKQYQIAGEDAGNFNLDVVGAGIRPFVENLFSLYEAGQISKRELDQVIDAVTDLDKETSNSAAGLKLQAQRFAEEADAAGVSAEAHDLLQKAINGTDVGVMREALNELKAKYPEVAEAAGLAATGTEKVDSASAGAASSINAAGSAADGAAGSLSALGDGAGTAADGLLDLLDAQDAAEDGSKRIADAEKDLADILSGNTEGVRTATESLQEAQKALADARGETGPGSKASKDAARDLREARKALREAQVDAGREPQAGDFFEDKRDAVLDALDRVGEAQQKLDEINAGTSEQVKSAAERVAEAEKKLGEELAKTGPASQEARDAQEALSDAQRDGARTSQGFADALAASTEGSIPDQIAALDALRTQYGLNKDEVDQLIGSLLVKAALEQGAGTAGTPAPVSSVGPTASPGFRNAESTQRTGTPAPTTSTARPGFRNADREGQASGAAGTTTITDEQAARLGFPTAAALPSRDGYIFTGTADGSYWKFDQKTGLWTQIKAGPGRAYGGDVWSGTMHPVNELGQPEMFTDQSGGQYLLPSQSGTVTPMGDVVGAIQAMHRDFLRTAPTAPDGSELAALLQTVIQRLDLIAAGNQRTAADVRRGAVAFA